MEIINIKDLPSGSTIVEVEFDSQQEYEFYWKVGKDIGLTLNEFFTMAIQDAVKNVIYKKNIPLWAKPKNISDYYDYGKLVQWPKETIWVSTMENNMNEPGKQGWSLF